MDNLVAYCSSPDTTSYFCPTCGCHVFLASREGTTSTAAEEDKERWAIVTGTIVGSPKPEDTDSGQSAGELVSNWEWVHNQASDTQDGGISI